MRSGTSLISTLLLSLSLFACSGLTQTKTSELPTPDNSLQTNHSQVQAAFHLDVGDVIDIKVYGEQDLDGTYQIYPECKIQFPMIKEVQICGRTPSQIQQNISDRLYKDYFKQMPSVVVKVREFNSKKIHIFGEVTKPGRYDYIKGLTLVQAIAMAGGFSPRASSNNTRLIRSIAGVRKIYRISLGGLGKNFIRDLYIRPGDIIFVPKGWL